MIGLAAAFAYSWIEGLTRIRVENARITSEFHTKEFRNRHTNSWKRIECTITKLKRF